MFCRRRNGADVGQGPGLHRSFQTELSRTMRTTKDRIRHLVLFEVTALLILVPIGAVFFGFDPFEIGALGASTAAIAAVWNYVYNLGFDRILKRLTGSVHKRMRVRVVDAVRQRIAAPSQSGTAGAQRTVARRGSRDPLAVPGPGVRGLRRDKLVRCELFNSRSHLELNGSTDRQFFERLKATDKAMPRCQTWCAPAPRRPRVPRA